MCFDTVARCIAPFLALSLFQPKCYPPHILYVLYSIRVEMEQNYLLFQKWLEHLCYLKPAMNCSGVSIVTRALSDEGGQRNSPTRPG